MSEDRPEYWMARAAEAVRAGAWTAARDALIACVRRFPAFGAGYLALADLFEGAGRRGPAAEALSHGLHAVAAGQDRTVLARRLLPYLAPMAPATYHPTLDRDVLACMTAEGIDPQPLARVATHVLLAKYPDGFDAADPLLDALLTRCINVDPAMERRLVALRRGLLLSGDGGALAQLVALQADAGEYVWPVAPDEAALLEGTGPVLAAMYRRPVSGDGLGGRLAERLVAEPAEEARLAASLPTFDRGESEAGDVVRDHYEANPYPRWTAAPASPPTDLRAVVSALPGVDRDALPPSPLAVLIAGAGTGYEAIDLARSDPGLAITAIDISRASLAHARRMAIALGVEGLDFAAGDLLQVARMGRRFDLIVSTGVLHHLADPAAGLAALSDVLEPGGVMRIALYSRRARALVREAHALIAAHGWEPTIEGIRAFRAAVLALPADVPLSRLQESDDFWSASGCRDLVFHVREHHYDLPGIGALAAANGLRLVAVDAPPAGRAAYGAGDRLDLGRWDAVEAASPAIFAGMIHCWLQKPGTHAAART